MPGWDSWEEMRSIVDDTMCRALDAARERATNRAPQVEPDGELQHIAVEQAHDLPMLLRKVDLWIAKQLYGRAAVLRCEKCLDVISYDVTVKPDSCPHCGYVFADHVTCKTCGARTSRALFEAAGNTCPLCVGIPNSTLSVGRPGTLRVSPPHAPSTVAPIPTTTHLEDRPRRASGWKLRRTTIIIVLVVVGLLLVLAALRHLRG